MTVKDLINILQQMPSDAEVITFANNHFTSQNGKIKVSGFKSYWTENGVIIGNFNPWHVDGPFKDNPNAPKLSGFMYG